VIDITALTKPVSKKSPVGTDCRLNEETLSLYRQVKDARTEARLAERKFLQGEDSDKSRAHWQTVLEQGQVILSTVGKDLEILAWMIEALLRLQGFAGLKAGFELTQSCVDQFQTTLFPTLEPDEDPTWQTQALTGLNGDEIEGSLIQPIFQVSLTEQADIALWQYQQAQQIAEMSDTKLMNQMLQDGALKLSECQDSIAESSDAFYTKLKTDLAQSICAFDAMVQSLDSVFGEASPPSSRIAEALIAYQNQLNYLLSDRSPVVATREPVDEEAPITVISAATSGSDKTGYTRESALKELANIATYFTKAEPQSPLPYMINRVVDWAQLPLPDLLAKMIQNQSELNEVYSLTGIPKNTETNH